jgi:hypothetical protein
MILSLVAVGEKYVKNCEPFINSFIDNGWDVHILTNQPEYFKAGKIDVYNHKVFSYFHKLLYPLQLVEKYKDDVLYIDADWIQNISIEFPKTFTKADTFLYYGSWPNGDKYINYKEDLYFKPLNNFWENLGFNPNEISTMLEWIFYIPYNEKIKNIIYDVELIKPIFEYMSLMTDTGYSGIGNGEGLGLSYALYKNGIPIKTFEKSNFKIYE